VVYKPVVKEEYNRRMPYLTSSPCAATEADLFPDGVPSQRHQGAARIMLKIASSNTILYCNNWKACVHFYQDILKFKTSFAKDDWFRELVVNDNAHISLANVAHCTIPSGEGRGVTLSWQVEELEELRAYLQAQGIKVSEITSTSWRAPWFYAWDPEGHRIEFWTL
jgi:catechol 2,3-dioxygenase-like lactoylglutathione lyase family enzyme